MWSIVEHCGALWSQETAEIAFPPSGWSFQLVSRVAIWPRSGPKERCQQQHPGQLPLSGWSSCPLKAWVIHLGLVGNMGSKFQDWYQSTCTARLGGQFTQKFVRSSRHPKWLWRNWAPQSGGTSGDLRPHEAQLSVSKLGTQRLWVCRIIGGTPVHLWSQMGT